MNLSVVIPTFNEEGNVEQLYREIKIVMQRLDLSYEIIFVDDGSTDMTYSKLLNLSQKDNSIRIIKFRKNFGQTAALNAGFRYATGEIIISMDADLQNDPADIPALLNKLDQGVDLVSGWRKNRKDSPSKRLISRGANFLRKIFIHDSIHDSGCTLKAYRAEALRELELYGEMHRFIPALVAARGFRVDEIEVNHRPRKAGKTKYSPSRIIKGFMDILVVTFWMNYGVRPAHLFGGIGLITSLFGFVVAVYLSIQKIFFGMALGNRPLLLLSILMIIFGTQFIIFGFLADIMMKIFYSSKDRPPYVIEKIIG